MSKFAKPPGSIAKTLIIGGGIAGPVMALALQKAGIASTVFEGSPSTSRVTGGTITVAPNGLEALRILGVDAAVRAVGLPMTRTVVANGRGKPFGEFPGLLNLPASQALWRTDLYQALHDHAVAHGVQIEFGKRLVGVEESPTSILARFADGSTASADILIGADGIRSTVRTLIDPHAPGPEHVPLLNFGGAANVALPAKADAMYFVFGKRAFLGYWAQPGGSTAWFANVPHEKPMTSAEARAVPMSDWMGYLREIYADDVPGRMLLQHTDVDQLGAFGSVEIMPKVPHWYRDRMVLVGDSVHAPSPSSGQGASLASESAIQLARCLRDLPDASTAFAAYERLRRYRVEKVAARAAKTNSSKALGRTALSMMSLIMPIAMKTFLTPERMLGLEQRYRIDWDEVAA